MSEPVITQKKPYVIDEKARRVAWCACGRSQNQPYCDGTHAGTEFRPVIVDLTEDRKVAWCGCRRSGKKPYCDGTHQKL